MPIGSSDGNLYENESAHALGIPMEQKVADTKPQPRKPEPYMSEPANPYDETSEGKMRSEFKRSFENNYPAEISPSINDFETPFRLFDEERAKWLAKPFEERQKIIQENKRKEIEQEEMLKMSPNQLREKLNPSSSLPIEQPKKEEIPITRQIGSLLESFKDPKNIELLNELWPVKLVKGLVESAKGLATESLPAPGTRPEDYSDNPNAEFAHIGRAADIASLITLGPAPLAGKLAEGTLGSFAGVSALGTNFKALTKAQEMFQIGKSATEIWRETGFFKGLDNKWRWEIPGAEKATLHPGLADVKIPPDGNVSISLGGLLNYPQLFEAYPHLRNMKVILDNDVRGPNGKLVFGGINEKGDTLVLNLDAMKVHNYPVKDVLIHEIQHLIQVKEGFPRGTNPKAAIDAAELTLRRKLLDRIDELTSKGHSFQDRAKDPYYSELKGVMKELMANREALSEHIYRATPGELEANLAAYRSQKPGDLKKMSPPTKSLDILSVIKPVEYPAPFRMPEGTTATP